MGPGSSRGISCTYDLYGPARNVFDACRSITWASRRGLGPENLDFFGLHGTRLTARCHFTEPKKVSISRAPPPPICHRNESARIKHIRGRINHRYILLPSQVYNRLRCCLHRPPTDCAAACTGLLLIALLRAQACNRLHS
jgi:hypothetical protein